MVESVEEATAGLCDSPGTTSLATRSKLTVSVAAPFTLKPTSPEIAYRMPSKKENEWNTEQCVGTSRTRAELCVDCLCHTGIDALRKGGGGGHVALWRSAGSMWAVA